MGNTCLNNDVRLHFPDNFLHSHDILRVLDDRTPKPLKII